jgi:uncharacterized membrane protein ArfC
MQDLSWWLMAVAFLLGLILTLFLVIHRVIREVPVYAGNDVETAEAAGFLRWDSGKSQREQS